MRWKSSGSSDIVKLSSLYRFDCQTSNYKVEITATFSYNTRKKNAYMCSFWMIHKKIKEVHFVHFTHLVLLPAEDDGSKKVKAKFWKIIFIKQSEKSI